MDDELTAAQVGNDILLSPSHMLLGLGMFLIVSGPFVADLRRDDRGPSLARRLPKAVGEGTHRNRAGMSATAAFATSKDDEKRGPRARHRPGCRRFFSERDRPCPHHIAIHPPSTL